MNLLELRGSEDHFGNLKLVKSGGFMVEKDIFLLRHGDTGRAGCYIGSTDVPLAASGQQQVRDIGRMLRQKNIEKIFTSPMLRCLQSLALLDLQIPYTVCDLIREVDFGRWEEKTFSEIAAVDAKLVDAWTTDSGHFCFPGGEAMADFQERIAAVYKLLRDDRSQSVLMVTHGGVIRHLMCLCLGISFEKYLAFDVLPCSCASLRLYSGGGVLTGMNIRA